MLLLFAFSITPKKTLHDFFANHRDMPSKCTGDGGMAKITFAGFHCHCEDLVVVSPFIETPLSVEMIACTPGAIRYCMPGTGYYQAPGLYDELRGPPMS